MNAEIEQARFNMIEQQIRTWEVLDATVLDLLKVVPREAFVPKQYAGLAFADLEIPIGHGELMWSPKLEARILQALALKKTDRVLEIGTGSGYMTALLSKLASYVVSIERIAEFSQQADRHLHQQEIRNVQLIVADGIEGYRKDAPYDAIVLTGSVPVLPKVFETQLKVGGRLVAVVGEGPVMEATLYQKVEEGVMRSDVLFEISIPALINAPTPSKFNF